MAYFCLVQYPTFYLASKSPRRHQIFADAGFQTEILENLANESFDENMPVREVAEYLAKQKALPFLNQTDKVIVTADTTVVIDNTILNKPENEAHAKDMLRALSGRMHEVLTGVAVIYNGNLHSFTQSTHVYIKPLSEAEIDYYIKEYKPFDKAGAYGIQDWMGLVGVEKIEGCYYNVMGFPMHRFMQEFSALMA
jgi:septum formation protein